MDEKGSEKIAEFDNTFSSDSLRRLKILYFFLPPSSRKGLACYIKMAELQLVLNAGISLLSSCEQATGQEFSSLVDEMLPYCRPQEAERLKQMQSMMQQFESMQDMLQTLQLMQELMPQAEEGSSSSANFDPEQFMNLFNMMNNI